VHVLHADLGNGALGFGDEIAIGLHPDSSSDARVIGARARAGPLAGTLPHIPIGSRWMWRALSRGEDRTPPELPGHRPRNRIMLAARCAPRSTRGSGPSPVAESGDTPAR
jgi:hypothetical protein